MKRLLSFGFLKARGKQRRRISRFKYYRQSYTAHWPLLFLVIVIFMLSWLILQDMHEKENNKYHSTDDSNLIIRTFSDMEAADYAQQIKASESPINNNIISGAENDHWIPRVNKDYGGYQQSWIEGIPVVFVITPTYYRHLQRAELTRLSHTLRLVTNLHWIIVEDSETRTGLVTRFLKECGIRHTHLNTRTNEAYRDYIKKLPRGVDQRNVGLEWLRLAIKPGSVQGVVYFGDDDNVYDEQLFDKIRYTKGVSMFPVGWTGLAKWSGPVCQGYHVTGFHTNYAPDRTFPTDMAGFAVNLDLLLRGKPRAQFKPIRGQIETTFLEQLTEMTEIEGIPRDCSEVLVWHTRTRIPRESLKGENELQIKGEASDPNVET